MPLSRHVIARPLTDVLMRYPSVVIVDSVNGTTRGVRWEVEGEEPRLAGTGDIMLVPKGRAHNIVTVSDEPALRFAIVIPDVPHVDSEIGEVFT